MNYYERHIGDYIRDTVSLTMLEDGAYNRLIDQYYQAERPLPRDKKEVYRMARATSAAERKAVDYVLGRYFELTDDGYRQKRCDELIEAFWERDQGAESKRENDRERQRRARERRKELFEALRRHGIVPAFNAPTKELHAELSRVTGGDNPVQVTQSVTRDNTATQSPITNPQTPNKNPTAAASVTGEPAQQGAEPPSAAAEIALKLIGWERARGKVPRGISASNAQVMDLAGQQPTSDELRKAYDLAVADREATGDTSPVNAGFVLALLPKVRNPPQPRAPKPIPLHAMTDAQLNAEGKRVGAGEARIGESRHEFIARIQTAQAIAQGRAVA